MRRDFLIVVVIIVIDFGCCSQPFTESTLQSAHTGTMRAACIELSGIASSSLRANPEIFKSGNGALGEPQKMIRRLTAIKFRLGLLEEKQAYNL
jgi:hypothetical protein